MIIALKPFSFTENDSLRPRGDELYYTYRISAGLHPFDKNGNLEG